MTLENWTGWSISLICPMLNHFFFSFSKKVSEFQEKNLISILSIDDLRQSQGKNKCSSSVSFSSCLSYSHGDDSVKLWELKDEMFTSRALMLSNILGRSGSKWKRLSACSKETLKFMLCAGAWLGFCAIASYMVDLWPTILRAFLSKNISLTCSCSSQLKKKDVCIIQAKGQEVLHVTFLGFTNVYHFPAALVLYSLLQ